MGWNRATPGYNPPVVGYSNGQCQGFQASLTDDPAAYLNLCRRLIYRIDQSFAQEVQINRGNLALMQQQDKGAVFMQQGKGRESARQEAIIQQFPEKSVSAMEEKLNLALQKAQK